MKFLYRSKSDRRAALIAARKKSGPGDLHYFFGVSDLAGIPASGLLAISFLIAISDDAAGEAA
jgi:hypothetical protein